MTQLAEPNGRGQLIDQAATMPMDYGRSRDLTALVRDNPLAIYMDAELWASIMRTARVLKHCCPQHLREKKDGQIWKALPDEVVEANCVRVVSQAFRWGFDPFAVADSSFVVGGKLGYEGKLVAALINTRANLIGTLVPTYNDDGADRPLPKEQLICTIHGQIRGWDAPRTVEIAWQDAKTDNQMWSKDPRQKLFYSGVVKWARRHAPHVVMGVLTDDDLDAMTVDEAPTPRAKSLEDITARMQQHIGHQPAAVIQQPVAQPAAAQPATTPKRTRKAQSPQPAAEQPAATPQGPEPTAEPQQPAATERPGDRLIDHEGYRVPAGFVERAEVMRDVDHFNYKALSQLVVEWTGRCPQAVEAVKALARHIASDAFEVQFSAAADQAQSPESLMQIRDQWKRDYRYFADLFDELADTAARSRWPDSVEQ